MINKFYRIIQVFKLIHKFGIKKSFSKINEKWIYRSFSNIVFKDQTEDYFNSQKETKFIKMPKISIVVPIYNTDSLFLEQMIESVLAQTYTNFELCLFNGGSTDNNVEKVINSFKAKSDKIIYDYSEINHGIAENTNLALKLATGEYIGLLDHDDLLTKDALYEVVLIINKYEADVIYSDEDKIIGNTGKHISMHKKPDWSPDMLLSYNYICHFLVFKTSLLLEVGEFNSEFDGSQDYDFILRLTSKAEYIHHISKVLYHWRITENSTAASYSAKSYALLAGKNALQNYVLQKDKSLEVHEGAFNGAFNLKVNSNKNIKTLLLYFGYWQHENDLEKNYKNLNLNSNQDHFKVIMINLSEYESKIKKYRTRNLNYTVYDGFKKSIAELLNVFCENEWADYFIILNANVRFLKKNWQNTLIEEATVTNSVIISPKILNKIGRISSYGLAITKDQVRNIYNNINSEYYGYFGRLKISQNISAVSPELFLIKKEGYRRYGRFSEYYETDFTVIDYCIEVNKQGGHVKLVNHELLYTNHSHLYTWPKKEVNYMLEKNNCYLQSRDCYYPLEFLYKFHKS